MTWYAEAAVKDLESMTWYTFNGPKPVKLGIDKQFNQKHPLVVRPGELVALKTATRGPGVGNYRVVLGHAIHVLFRNVPQKMIDKIANDLKKYKGKIPTHDVVPEGEVKRRATKIRIRDRVESDKQTDDLFKPTGTVRETSTYNRENYQWRKVIHGGVPVKSLKQGRSKYSTQPDEVIGLRYMTKARGGFVILPNDQRVNIDHDTYMKLVESTRILPTSKQQKGLVIVADIKATMPKQTRVRKPKEPEPDVRDTIKPETAAQRLARRLGHDVKKTGSLSPHADAPDAEWDDDEDDAEVAEIPDDAGSTVPESKQPASVLKVGLLIQSAKRPENKFVVVDSTVNNDYTEFALYGLVKKDVRKMRIVNDQDMTKYRSVAVVGEASKSEMAAGKRALNGAVKNKKFTVGSIHDQ